MKLASVVTTCATDETRTIEVRIYQHIRTNVARLGFIQGNWPACATTLVTPFAVRDGVREVVFS